MPSAADVAPAELESYLQRLFQIGDRNGDGVLSPAEFESLLRKSGFKFDDATIRRIMNAVDTNHDGVIQYEEFVPAILALVRHKSSAPAAAPAPTAAPAAGMPNLSDVPPAQLERYMQRLFKIQLSSNRTCSVSSRLEITTTMVSCPLLSSSRSSASLASNSMMPPSVAS
eukprot:TRINITY_DN786_c0_g1_i8.p1 TRINITY_DN786_c0_g1~~TRINITY_DN786_c0_g1_i8.p1  ORF type:complete len:170 (+),score=46.67 TRINITY_DN786_c0_g1_i8:1-510(+)